MFYAHFLNQQQHSQKKAIEASNTAKSSSHLTRHDSCVKQMPSLTNLDDKNRNCTVTNWLLHHHYYSLLLQQKKKWVWFLDHAAAIIETLSMETFPASTFCERKRNLSQRPLNRVRDSTTTSLKFKSLRSLRAFCVWALLFFATKSIMTAPGKMLWMVLFFSFLIRQCG